MTCSSPTGLAFSIHHSCPYLETALIYPRALPLVETRGRLGIAQGKHLPLPEMYTAKLTRVQWTGDISHKRFQLGQLEPVPTVAKRVKRLGDEGCRAVDLGRGTVWRQTHRGRTTCYSRGPVLVTQAERRSLCLQWPVLLHSKCSPSYFHNASCGKTCFYKPWNNLYVLMLSPVGNVIYTTIKKVYPKQHSQVF